MELCPKCGEFTDRLSERYGWCKSCTNIFSYTKKLAKPGNRIISRDRRCVICSDLIFSQRDDSLFCGAHSPRGRARIKYYRKKYGLSKEEATVYVTALYRKDADMRKTEHQHKEPERFNEDVA